MFVVICFFLNATTRALFEPLAVRRPLDIHLHGSASCAPFHIVLLRVYTIIYSYMPCSLYVQFCSFCVAVLTGRITGLARPPARLSVSYGLLTGKQKGEKQNRCERSQARRLE